MKRLVLLSHGLIVLSLLLTACGAGGGLFAPTPEPAQLVFAAPNENSDYYTAKIAEFHALNPLVEIKLVGTSSASTADVAALRWDEIYNSSGDQFAKALDITPFVEQTKGLDRGDYFAGVLDPFTRDGKIKGLPTGVDPYVMFYNRDLFDQFGVAYPKAGWSWDDFRTSALQLRDPVTKTFGYVSTLNYVDSLFFIYQHGGNLLPAGSQTPQLDSPEAIEAMEWYANLYLSTNVAPTPDQARTDLGGDAMTGIVRGKIGMWMGPLSGLRGPDGKGWPFNLGIVPLPRDVTGFSVAQFEGLMISADTKSPQTSWKWMSFLVNQPLPWAVPARQSLANSPAFTDALGKDQAEAGIAALKDANMITTFDFRAMNNIIEVFSVATAAIVEGKATAAEALTAAQKKVSP